MVWRIVKTEKFDKLFSKLDKSVRDKINRELSQLELNPYVGRPLGLGFLEKKRLMDLEFIIQYMIIIWLFLLFL